MDLNLAGKVAVVTGAGKGIGLATAKALADEGAHVVAGSLTTGSLEDLKGVSPVAVDLTAPDGPAQLIRRATEEQGQLDVLVNNVGAVRMRTEGFFGTSDEDFRCVGIAPGDVDRLAVPRRFVSLLRNRETNQGDELFHPKCRSVKGLGKFVSATPPTPLRTGDEAPGDRA